jgi:hypothetical protein
LKKISCNRGGRHYGLLDKKISIFWEKIGFFWEKSDFVGKNRIFWEKLKEQIFSHNFFWEKFDFFPFF